MVDPITIIGAIASIVDLIDFSVKALKRLNEYRHKGDELPAAFVHIATQLPLLLRILDRSKEGIAGGAVDADDSAALEPCILACQEQIKKLNNILTTILPKAQEEGVKKLLKGLRSIWKESEVREIDNEISHYVNTTNGNKITDCQQWLAPPDPFVDLRKSLKSRTPNTGNWYLQSPQYTAWKAGNAQFTWLYGAPGSGKTILSSSIIDDLQAYCKDDAARSMAFFFFSFNDAEKQKPINMLKSLIYQLLQRCPRFPEKLRTVHDTCKSSRRSPSEEELLDALQDVIELLPASYIVIDALDECTASDALFDALEQMHSWRMDSMHVLLTSRPEVDIEEALELYVPSEKRICLETRLVDKDIQTYVHERLLRDASFRRWQKDQHKHLQEEIEVTLGRKAHGMFRWAACQMDTLARCLTAAKVRSALQDLPKTLYDTYARILRNIDEGPHAEEAVKLLRWLAHSRRPLKAVEALEVTGIIIGEDCHFDRDAVLVDSSDISRICSSLVSIGSHGTEEDEIHNEDEDDKEDDAVSDGSDTEAKEVYVRLAHFSVKEYLVSTRPCIPKFSFLDKAAHDTLAIDCLVYLLRFEKEECQNLTTDFPLADYAALRWTEHAQISNGGSRLQQELSMKLLTRSARAMLAWVNTMHQLGDDQIAPTALYMASHQGLVRTVSAILEEPLTDVNAIQPGYCAFGTALQAASNFGYKEIVEILLAKGADINVQGGGFDTALQAASFYGEKEIVEILLAKGADINVQGGRFGTALYAASAAGNEKMIEILLANGADANAQGGGFGTALQAASAAGSKKIIEILLANGANANVQAGKYGTALQAASAAGHKKIVETLLANGADANVQGGGFDTALQAASYYGEKEIVEILLANGANTNVHGGRYGTALQAASYYGDDYLEVVELLLAKGADVNAQGGYYGNALRAAVAREQPKTVEMLRAAGAIETEADDIASDSTPSHEN